MYIACNVCRTCYHWIDSFETEKTIRLGHGGSAIYEYVENYIIKKVVLLGVIVIFVMLTMSWSSSC